MAYNPPGSKEETKKDESVKDESITQASTGAAGAPVEGADAAPAADGAEQATGEGASTGAEEGADLNAESTQGTGDTDVEADAAAAAATGDANAQAGEGQVNGEGDAGASQEETKDTDEAVVEEAVVETAPVDEHPDLPQLKSQLARYAELMAVGRPHQKGEGANGQMVLYRVYLFLFSRRGEAFSACANAICEFFDKNNSTLFSTRYASRYVNEMPLGAKNREMFVEITYVFSNLSNPSKRVLALTNRSIDIVKATAHVPDATAAALLQEYFTPRI